MKTNVKTKTPTIRNFNGFPVKKQTPQHELLRAVSACMLFESSFYESGMSVANRIVALCDKVSGEDLCNLAIYARENLKLRHVPLFLIVQIFKKPAALRGPIRQTIERVIQRVDELAELVSLYWKNGKRPLPRQMKLGLADAFAKFDEYQFAKYDSEGSIRLRDVMFLVHPEPSHGRGALYTRIANRELKTPDTWETELSSGANKRETFTRLIEEEKLGYMALLRNLRNMAQSGVSNSLVSKALIDGAARSKALPFRFIAAAKAAPEFADACSTALQLSAAELPKLTGRTIILVDVSGSMNDRLSGKSDLNRLQAASALAILCREVCENCRVYTFSNSVKQVSNYRGLPLADAIDISQPHGGTELRKAILDLPRDYDRLIVITDEQSQDGIADPVPGSLAYIINVASYTPALPDRGKFVRVNGFSERILDWIMLEESYEE